MTTIMIDLNCDLGESFGRYKLGLDEEILPYISSVNIACGFHASDPETMEKTVHLAEKYDVAIGAHPGLPDLIGFGRRAMALTPKEAKAIVKYQIGALMAFTKENNLHHVKPHGALYNMAAKDPLLARAICSGVQEVDSSLILYGLAGSELIKAAKEMGLPYANEVFADRNVENDGTLVSRTEENALITDEDLAVNRVSLMITKGEVESVHGEQIKIDADTICLHGDNPHAVAFAEKMNRFLKEQDIQIKAI